MDILEKFENMVETLGEHTDADNRFRDLREMALELKSALEGKDLIKYIEIVPNDMGGSSVVFKLHGMPELVILKAWTDSDVYYCGLFTRHVETHKNPDGTETKVKLYMDSRIENSFNEAGIMVSNTIDELEDMLLVYMANTYYIHINTSVL